MRLNKPVYAAVIDPWRQAPSGTGSYSTRRYKGRACKAGRRRSLRVGGKVREEAVANLSGLPDDAIAAIRGSVRGAAPVTARVRLPQRAVADYEGLPSVDRAFRRLEAVDLNIRPIDPPT